MNCLKAVWGLRFRKYTEIYILESVLPKEHLEKTNRSTYPEACLFLSARSDLLKDKAYYYEQKPGRGH